MVIMPTKSGLPGWFPEDFSVNDELLSAFEQPVTTPAKGKKSKKARKDGQEPTAREGTGQGTAEDR
jgi:hypothetical protein